LSRPERVRFSNLTMTQPQYFVRLFTFNVNTNPEDAKKPRVPQFSFQNIKERDTRVFGLGITPNSAFRDFGVIEIFLNEVKLFPAGQTTFGVMRNISALNFPIPPNFGLKIFPSKKLEVFAWQPAGVELTSINFVAFIGDIQRA